MMEFRRAKLCDVRHCLYFEPTRGEEDLRWHAQAGLLFLADADDQVLAYARVESFWATMPYLALIVVHKDHRGGGIGTGLLTFIRDDLRARGYKHLLSSSTANEPEPQHWHELNGFVPIGALEGLNAEGVDEVFFRLEL